MLEATIEALRSEALGADDASGYFAAMYARVTDRVRASITSGRFGDGGQMDRFNTDVRRWVCDRRSSATRRPLRSP